MTSLAVAKFFETDIATSITALAAVLTFVTAAVAIIYARRQLGQARDASQIDLAFRLYDRQLTPEFARHIAIAGDFVTIDGEGTEGADGAKAFNKWEALAVAHRSWQEERR